MAQAQDPSPKSGQPGSSLRQQGRVHRLHFAVHASLPMGTTLRVTTFGRDATYNDDPFDDGPKIATPESLPHWLDAIPRDYRRQLRDSVELYTTPETYPLWRTKRPVVTIDDGGGGSGGLVDVVVSDPSGPLLHRYRYVAVSPGASIDWAVLSEGKDEDYEEEEEDVADGGGEEFPPVLFEVPPSCGERAKISAHPPYRTRVLVHGNNGDGNDNDMDLGNNDTMDVEHEVIVDHWNKGDDPSFQHFREMMIMRQKETERAKSPLTTNDQTEEDVDMINDNDEKDQKESIYIVCYHLPVILSRDAITSTWEACWAESLIAKTEKDGISSTRKTTWIGTVSNVPESTLMDPNERDAIRTLLKGMDCIPVFFYDDEYLLDNNMYLGFCKQVLRPSFHNVDLLDLAMNGWGQRQRDTNRLDPVRACQVAAEEAKERRRSLSGSSMAGGLFDDGASPMTDLTAPSPLAPVEGYQQQRSGSPSDWDQRRLDSWWNAYIRVNETVARVVADLVIGGDIVWVHDYHLSLLPRMLREMRKEANVAGHSVLKEGGGTTSPIRGHMPVRMIFFIHVPFPTSMIFRELEHGEALLEGMLHADVIGFHSFDHERHFLNAAKRILGLKYESLVGGLIGIRYRGTKVVVTVSNVSVEADIIDALLESPSVTGETGALRKKHAGRDIISGIAVAQRLSGISYTLMAYERLLTDYPVWQSRVVLLQRCLIPGERRVDEVDTLREIRWLVQRIRNRFGPMVIDYEEQVCSVLPIDQRLAIWTSSKVMMHTPIREGLNLFPMEFVYTHKEPADPGVVVASEFSAVSSILNGALRVNPYDVQNFVTTIDKALSMSLNEREGRRDRDIDFVSTCPSGLWTRNVLRDLDDATLQQSANMEAISTVDKSPEAIMAREAELGLERLDLPALERAYASTKSRVIIVDYNGTLVAKEAFGKYLKREILGTSGSKPSHIMFLALQKLCADPKNTVYIVSGDSQQNLESAICKVPGLGLAASNGTCFADPGGQERVWQFLDYGFDWDDVKMAAMPIISKFTARTNGSYVKLSHCSIGWSYYSSDPEWGSLQASYLVAELGQALQSFDVRFVALKGIVEVVPRKAHKGQIVTKILEKNKEVDFVLCMGDDISDEKMFTSVFNYLAGSKSDNSYAFNVAVGRKPTNATFYVDDAADVECILVALVGDKNLLQRQVSDEGLRTPEDLFSSFSWGC